MGTRYASGSHDRHVAIDIVREERAEGYEVGIRVIMRNKTTTERNVVVSRYERSGGASSLTEKEAVIAQVKDCRTQVDLERTLVTELCHSLERNTTGGIVVGEFKVQQLDLVLEVVDPIQRDVLVEFDAVRDWELQRVNLDRVARQPPIELGLSDHELCKVSKALFVRDHEWVYLVDISAFVASFDILKVLDFSQMDGSIVGDPFDLDGFGELYASGDDTGMANVSFHVQLKGIVLRVDDRRSADIKVRDIDNMLGYSFDDWE